METREITQEEYRALMGRKGPNKYGAIRTEVDAGMADSRAEARRWEELRLRERAGEIEDLMFHPVFELLPKRPGWPAISYEGDSQYWEGGRLVVEDVKGGGATQTPAFRIKARLFVDRYPHIDFRIVER